VPDPDAAIEKLVEPPAHNVELTGLVFTTGAVNTVRFAEVEVVVPDAFVTFTRNTLPFIPVVTEAIL
jgi:hypothetical protein